MPFVLGGFGGGVPDTLSEGALGCRGALGTSLRFPCVGTVFLQMGADLQRTSVGDIPEMFTARAAVISTEILKILLERGVGPTMADGKAPLLIGRSKRPQKEMIRLLVDAHAKRVAQKGRTR